MLPALPEPIGAEDKFKAYLAAFRREVQRLGMFISLYHYLHERRHDRLEELNIAPAFFQTILTALRTGIIIWCHKLLIGGTEGEISMRSFLNFVGQNLFLFTTDAFRERRGLTQDAWQVKGHQAPTVQEVRLDRRRLNALTATESLRSLRNRFHAHFDEKYFLTPEVLVDEAPLRWNELDQIRSVIEDILNRYSVALDGNYFLFEPLNVLDVEHVIEALRRFNAAGDG